MVLKTLRVSTVTVEMSSHYSTLQPCTVLLQVNVSFSSKTMTYRRTTLPRSTYSMHVAAVTCNSMSSRYAPFFGKDDSRVHRTTFKTFSKAKVEGTQHFKFFASKQIFFPQQLFNLNQDYWKDTSFNTKVDFHHLHSEQDGR